MSLRSVFMKRLHAPPRKYTSVRPHTTRPKRIRARKSSARCGLFSVYDTYVLGPSTEEPRSDAKRRLALAPCCVHICEVASRQRYDELFRAAFIFPKSALSSVRDMS